VADGEQLLGERGGLAAGDPDGIDVGIGGVTLAEPAGQQLAVADDHGEQVVEVVGHATGEAAECLHALLLLQLALEQLTLGDVGQDAHEVLGGL
jgi:hypothetical protein